MLVGFFLPFVSLCIGEKKTYLLFYGDLNEEDAWSYIGTVCLCGAR